MIIQKLEQSEMFLKDRAARLKSSIKEINNNLEAESIEHLAEQLNSLETQLNLTEKALENTQKQLRERKEFESSKEYKERIKQAEELRKQAQRETVAVYENLLELQKDTAGIMKKVREFDRAERATGKEVYYGLVFTQPFAWLGMVQKNIEKNLKDTVWLKDKLKV